MSTASGTYRGGPSRGAGRATIPAFDGSPSAIPRPKLVEQTAAHQSESGTSTLSASRQKQSKKDEVGTAMGESSLIVLIPFAGDSKEDGGRSQQEEACRVSCSAHTKSSAGYGTCSQAEPSSPDQTEYDSGRSCSTHGSQARRLRSRDGRRRSHCRYLHCKRSCFPRCGR